MRTLIIVRHGDYSYGLTEDGRRQIAVIRDALGELLTASVAVLSSNAERALESAGILAAPAGVTPIANRGLYSDNETNYNVENILALALRHGMDTNTVVIMTHLEIVADLPCYVGRQFGIDIPWRELRRGTGIAIDLEAKTYKYVP